MVDFIKNLCKSFSYRSILSGLPVSSQSELLNKIDTFWRSLADSPIRLPDGNEKVLVASAGIAWAEPGNFPDI